MFHYISVFLILSSIVLLAVGLDLNLGIGTSVVIKFVALNYLFFALTQTFIVLTSNIEKGLFKMFQWTFFVVIAVTAWLGVS